MVGKWRSQFVALGLDDPRAPRSVTLRTIEDVRIDVLVAKMLQTAPVDVAHRSTRTVAVLRTLAQPVLERLAGLRTAAAPPEGLQASMKCTVNALARLLGVEPLRMIKLKGEIFSQGLEYFSDQKRA